MTSPFPFEVVSIHGVPRSGTSWLGQVFASHPDVAYRHQPLFAYRFKDRLTLTSTAADVAQFLHELYAVTDDEFILDRARRAADSAFWQQAQTSPHPRLLVMKMVRYHHLLDLLLTSVPGIRIIGLVRHPCAVIHSWLHAPKEFRPEWNPQEEWRYARKKNAGRIEEFNGYEKWKEVAQMFLRLAQQHPTQFSIAQYEQIVAAPEAEIQRLFEFVGLPMHAQTAEFLRRSHGRHDIDPYAVYKDPRRQDRWRTELDPTIAETILTDLIGSDLEQFAV